MEKESSPRENSIGAQMAIVLQMMKRNHHHALAESGYDITMEQLAVLETLKFRGEMNMTELSNAVWKQNANITRIVDKLEKKKLLERKPFLDDRRAFILAITEKGKKMFSNALPVVLEVYKHATSSITKEEHKTILAALKKMIRHLSSG